jgi:nicotinamidase-related amidase
MRIMIVAAATLLLSVAGAYAQSDSKSPSMGQDTALIIVDIQNFYFDKGLVPLVGSTEAAAQARRVLAAFRAKQRLIVHVRHVPTTVTLVDGEPSDPQFRIRPEVWPAAGEKVISKRFANSFRETDLLEYLREKHITRLVLIGMQTHMCVEAASRAATDLGFDVVVLDDACATRALTYGGRTVAADMVHTAALAAINGTYGRVTTVEQFLTQQ